MTPEIALSILATGALAAVSTLHNDNRARAAATVEVRNGYLDKLQSVGMDNGGPSHSVPTMPQGRGPRGRG